MFVQFFLRLKEAGLPIGLRELLCLQEALQQQVVAQDIQDFYYLCRSLFVKKEQQLDKFDRAFAEYFGELSNIEFNPLEQIPDDWLNKPKILDDKGNNDDAAYLKEALQALQQRFQELLKEQKSRHEGGSTWTGTGGRSPFGAWGFNQQGYRIGQQENRHNRAVKVWDQRDFRELDDSRTINTRQFQMALRRLRLLSREGAPAIFDVEETIRKTCHNGGILKEVYRPERSNGMKILLLLDVGGSMDEHVQLCEQLFTAARHEFQHLHYFYFHNCLYEKIWKDSKRRRYDFTATQQLFNTYSQDYRVVVVGDASMSPYELLYQGGSVEHVNEEAGHLWLERLQQHFPHTIWLNPVPQAEWRLTETIGSIKQIFKEKMYPLSLQGLESGVNALKG